MSLKFSIAGLLAFYLLIGACTKKSESKAEEVFHFDDTILVDGLTRSYTINLPPSYYDGSSFSLVLALHGGGGSAAQFEKSTKLTDKANAAGFIVVYPNGTGIIQTWNAGQCCGSAMTNNIDDVRFISRLIDKLINKYKIDPKKVYATGHSNGGMLCYRLACELADKLAAIAPNSCTMVTTACNPSKPVPILHMHSKLDEHVPYLGGYGNGITGIYCTPVDEVLNLWSAKNGCTNPRHLVFSDSMYSYYQWSGCNDSRIDYYLTDDGGHAWPGGLPGSANGDKPSAAINANDLLWNFFREFHLP